MRVLLTGCDGFIGGALQEYLVGSGHEVTGTCFLRPPVRGEISLDLTAIEQFRRLPRRRFDAVVHAAGLVDQKAARKRLYAVNAEGTRNLSVWARRCGCPHFVYLSSVSVYGLKTIGQDRAESTTRRSRGAPFVPYMGSKARAERHIEAGGSGFTILRLPAVLGRLDSYLSPTIIRALLDGSFFFCGDGLRRVSLLYVRNLGPIVDGLLAAGPTGQAFNCCDAHVIWRSLVAEYARRLGVELPRRRRSAITLASHLADKHYLLLLTFSRFGSHFPDDALYARFDHHHQFRWQEGVGEAVAAYLAAGRSQTEDSGGPG
jgi:nucleoside-diphosphate-sugar epimerase